MSLSGFVLRNAFRNKRRLTLSVSSVAASLFLLVMLQVALRELTNPINDEGSSLRIIVRNKVSLAQPLPARQLQVLERIPGIVAVTPSHSTTAFTRATRSSPASPSSPWTRRARCC